MSITLDRLVSAAKDSTERQQRAMSADLAGALLRERGLEGRAPGAMRAALSQDGLAVIAEVKGASPVDGVLREGLDPPALAATYADAGAAAISVLTEERYFAGSLDHLEAVAATVRVPLLRKDFIVDEYQIARAALAGASAVLLLAEVLAPVRLRQLVARAHALGLDALVEIHDLESLPAAVASGSGLIGVNNRDLSTMRVDRDHCLRIADRLPRDVIRVAESGISLPEHAAAALEAGYDAILVGSALVCSDDPFEALRALRRGAP